jgi:hypothetical protein
MIRLSKGWMRLAGFGYGVMISLALRGGLQWFGWLTGQEVSDEVAGNVWLIGCLTLGPLFAWLYPRLVMAPMVGPAMQMGAKDR